MIKALCALLLSAAFILTLPAQINNSANSTKVQAVQAETPRKVSTLGKEQEKAQTEQQVVSEPETVVATQVIETAPQQQQGCNAYRSMFSRYSWDVNVAVAVCMAESSGNPRAISDTCDRGLMQINCIHADMVDGNLEALYDPATNIQVAYRVYQSQGWAGWSAYNAGRHLKFL